MFTHDGKKIVFASNRANAKRGDTNVFIAVPVATLKVCGFLVPLVAKDVVSCS